MNPRPDGNNNYMHDLKNKLSVTLDNPTTTDPRKMLLYKKCGNYKTQIRYQPRSQAYVQSVVYGNKLKSIVLKGGQVHKS